MGTGRGANGEDVARPAASVEELKRLNHRLRDMIAELKGSRERLEAKPAGPAPPAPSGESPEQALSRTRHELAAAREALEAYRAEEEKLRARLGELEREHRRVCEERAAAQRQHFAVASLFVTLARLHGALERREVLVALQEVVVNVLGSEQLAVYELGPGPTLRVVHSLGVDGARLADVPAGEGAIGRCALGHAFVAGAANRAEDPELTLCVPLQLGDAVTGAIAVWRLLHQKPFLDDGDLELVSLLSAHAGHALHAAGLHERQGR